MIAPACPSFAEYCFPAEIISQAVWLYFRFPLSLRMVEESLAFRGICQWLRDLAEMFLLHGIVFSHEAVRAWEAKLAPLLTSGLRQHRRAKGGPGRRSWHVDKKIFEGPWTLVLFVSGDRPERRSR
jgi:transposase-like protein